MFIRRLLFLFLLIASLPAFINSAYPEPAERTHLDWANALTGQIQPENTTYKHKNGYVRWKGENGAVVYESHTDCSGFLTELLKQAYGFTPEYFKQWLGKRRPHAKQYHEAITTSRGFRNIRTIGDVEPGDIIAVRYPPGAENTGHIMIAAAAPLERKASKPIIEGTVQWEIAVIDSSESGHGKTDSRRRKDGTSGSGAGTGILRIYTDLKGVPAGYTWSVFGNSEYYDQTVRPLVIGRLDFPAKQ